MEDRNETPVSVPWAVFRAIEASNKRRERWHWIFHILSLIVVLGTVIGLYVYLNQYDVFEVEYTQDGHGVNIIGDSNGVDYIGSAAESPGAGQEEPWWDETQGAPTQEVD